MDSSSPWCTDSLGQLQTWMSWKLPLQRPADPCLNSACKVVPLHKKYKVYLDRVGVAKVPENYEDRLTEIFPKVFKHLRLLALDPYDLALSKLERNIQRDRDDVKHLAKTVPLDLEVLKSDIRKSCAGSLAIPSARTSHSVSGSKQLKKNDRR